MKLVDYILLAKTKIKTRKVRSMLTLVSASVLTTSLLTASFVYTGAKNSIRGVALPKLVDKHIAVQNAVNYSYPDFDTIDHSSPDSNPDYAINIAPSENRTTRADLEKLSSEYSVQSVHEQYSLFGEIWRQDPDDSRGCYNFSGDYRFGLGSSQEYFEFAVPEDVSTTAPGSARADTCTSMAVRSDAFFDNFTEGDFSLSSYTGDAVPVTISSSYSLILTDQTILTQKENPAQKDSPAQIRQKYNKAKEQLLGSTLQLRYATYIEPKSIAHGEEHTLDSQQKPQTLTVQIVGIVPNQDELKDIAGVSLYGADDHGVVFPESYWANYNAESAAILSTDPGRATLASYLFSEFANKDDLRTYVKSGCRADECWRENNTKPEITYYTDYDLAIEETASSFWQFGRWVLGVFALGLAASIMSTTGKVILDSRKEIGVFRAIGAKRGQIAGVYSAYITMLMLASLALSFVAARIVTLILNAKFGAQVSESLAAIKNSNELTGHYSFFGISPMHLLYIAGFVILVGLIGSFIPVLRSLRKDPLRYLRED